MKVESCWTLKRAFPSRPTFPTDSAELYSNVAFLVQRDKARRDSERQSRNIYPYVFSILGADTSSMLSQSCRGRTLATWMHLQAIAPANW